MEPKLKVMNKKTQKYEILQYLLGGHKLTAYEALMFFGSLRLSARIHEIRVLGYPVETVMVEKNGKQIAEYFMGVPE
jgi:hypothetical protein